MAVQPEKWGKDHWSTFAFVETVIVDSGGRLRYGDNRMRTLLKEGNYPTRLKNGESIENHDDWDCLDDCEEAGLLVNSGTGLSRIYRLTDLGVAVASQLRQHKANGNNFIDFMPRNDELSKMKKALLGDHIVCTDGIRSGQPCVKGTRITATDVVEYLNSGMTPQQIVDDFTELTLEDIEACKIYVSTN